MKQLNKFLIANDNGKLAVAIISYDYNKDAHCFIIHQTVFHYGEQEHPANDLVINDYNTNPIEAFEAAMDKVIQHYHDCGFIDLPKELDLGEKEKLEKYVNIC